MRCIGDKALARGDQTIDPRRVEIDRVNQRLYFVLNVTVVDRRKIGWRAPRDTVAEPQQRLEPALQTKPNNERSNGDEQALAHQSVD